MTSTAASDLFTMLYDVSRLIRAEADRRARVDGMTLTQWKLLRQLERSPGLSQKEAADLLEVEPISVARLVDRLESAGLVERRPDAEDRRVWRLHLRPEAAQVLDRLDILSEELAEEMAAGIGPEQRRAMLDGLRRLRCNLSRPTAELSLKEAI